MSSSSQSNFVIENIVRTPYAKQARGVRGLSSNDNVNRYTTFQQIFREYNHTCRQEYTVSRALCVYCFHRLEASRGFPKKMIPAKCVCLDIPSYVSEQCVHCDAIKEEIVFLKNEIRRSCTTYGIEVAETLETNPLFGQTIDKLVLRIEILEQVLLRQLIDTETAARKEQQQDDVPDDVSDLSEEPAAEKEETAKEEGEDQEDDETQIQSMNDDMDISVEDVCNNTLRQVRSETHIHVTIPTPQPEPDLRQVRSEALAKLRTKDLEDYPEMGHHRRIILNTNNR